MQDGDTGKERQGRGNRNRKNRGNVPGQHFQGGEWQVDLRNGCWPALGSVEFQGHCAYTGMAQPSPCGAVEGGMAMVPGGRHPLA